MESWEVGAKCPPSTQGMLRAGQSLSQPVRCTQTAQAQFGAVPPHQTLRCCPLCRNPSPSAKDVPPHALSMLQTALGANGISYLLWPAKGPQKHGDQCLRHLPYRQSSVHRGGTNNSHRAQLYDWTAEQHGQDNPPEAVETSWATRHCTLVYTRCASLRKPTRSSTANLPLALTARRLTTKGSHRPPGHPLLSVPRKALQRP